MDFEEKRRQALALKERRLQERQSQRSVGSTPNAPENGAAVFQEAALPASQQAPAPAQAAAPAAAPEVNPELERLRRENFALTHQLFDLQCNVALEQAEKRAALEQQLQQLQSTLRFKDQELRSSNSANGRLQRELVQAREAGRGMMQALRERERPEVAAAVPPKAAPQLAPKVVVKTVRVSEVRAARSLEVSAQDLYLLQRLDTAECASRFCGGAGAAAAESSDRRTVRCPRDVQDALHRLWRYGSAEDRPLRVDGMSDAERELLGLEDPWDIFQRIPAHVIATDVQLQSVRDCLSSALSAGFGAPPLAELVGGIEGAGQASPAAAPEACDAQVEALESEFSCSSALQMDRYLERRAAAAGGDAKDGEEQSGAAAGGQAAEDKEGRLATLLYVSVGDVSSAMSSTEDAKPLLLFTRLSQLLRMWRCLPDEATDAALRLLLQVLLQRGRGIVAAIAGAWRTHGFPLYDAVLRESEDRAAHSGDASALQRCVDALSPAQEAAPGPPGPPLRGFASRLVGAKGVKVDGSALRRVDALMHGEVDEPAAQTGVGGELLCRALLSFLTAAHSGLAHDRDASRWLQPLEALAEDCVLAADAGEAGAAELLRAFGGILCHPCGIADCLLAHRAPLRARIAALKCLRLLCGAPRSKLLQLLLRRRGADVLERIGSALLQCGAGGAVPVLCHRLLRGAVAALQGLCDVYGADLCRLLVQHETELLLPRLFMLLHREAKAVGEMAHRAGAGAALPLYESAALVPVTLADRCELLRGTFFLLARLGAHSLESLEELLHRVPLQYKKDSAMHAIRSLGDLPELGGMKDAVDAFDRGWSKPAAKRAREGE